MGLGTEAVQHMQGRWDRRGHALRGTRDGAPAMSTCISPWPGLSRLSVLLYRKGVKTEVRCPSLPGTSLVYVSILLFYLADYYFSQKVSQFEQ